MVHILSVASLALAVVSAVSGHVIRHRLPPNGWEKSVLEPYDVYHDRYLDFDCYEKHNTTFFDECCHPLLKGESISVLHDRNCFSTAHDGDDCDDENSSIRPTPIPYSPAVMSSSPEHNTPTSSPLESPPPTSTRPALQHKLAEPSSTPETTYTKATSPSPSSTSTGNNDGWNFDGYGTWYYQNQHPGACGNVHLDTDMICAIDSLRYGYSGDVSSLCGKRVEIINLQNYKSVNVTVADDCPTCDNENSIDMSHGAFTVIADPNLGNIPIKWRFLS